MTGFEWRIVTICNNIFKKPKVFQKNADKHGVKKRNLKGVEK